MILKNTYEKNVYDEYIWQKYLIQKVEKVIDKKRHK